MAETVSLGVSGAGDDAALARLLREQGLALSVDEARRIAATLDRDPTLVEAHAFAAQWSEHCSYKSSRHLLRRLPTTGPTVMQGPQEDAGIVHLGSFEGRRYGIVIAHESHNHPSQVVPFEGAATGIGGIVRDVLCMGARVIALADPLRFGPREDPHCRYVAQGVVDGIAAYGNAIGVPNIAGDVYFHEGFRDNCLVNVVALGIVEERGIVHSRAPDGAAGWDIVLVGKATDRSGFGGAAFSSLVLDAEDAELNKGAVQVPDPFLKNVIMRASYRAFDVIAERGLTVGFKDLGAGGIMGCTAEIVSSGGYGAVVDLERCPTSQANLPAAVIAVGETQERLTWVVPPHFTAELLAIYNDEFSLPEIARGAQAAVVGRVTAEKRYVLRHGGETVMDVDIDFLTGDIRYDRTAGEPREAARAGDVGDARARRAAEAAYRELPATLARVLAHPDVCSRRPIYERFDSVVRGTTAIPCGYADAGVVVPVEGSALGVALGLGGNPRIGVLDAGLAAENAVLEAIRNVVAVGAVPGGMTDCLNFGNPERPEQMGELARAIDGLARAATELAVPFVSGNVSLYNTSAGGGSIPASPIVACVGTFADVSYALTPGLRAPGATLFFVGAFSDALGGSAFASVLGSDDARVERPEYARERVQIALLAAANAANLVSAAHDVSDGGLLVAIAEMAFATLAGEALGVACDADAPSAWTGGSTGDAEALFGESGGYVVETPRPDAFLALAAAHGVAAHAVGRVIAEPVLSFFGHRMPLRELYDAWSAPLADFYADAAVESVHA